MKKYFVTYILTFAVAFSGCNDDGRGEVKTEKVTTREEERWIQIPGRNAFDPPALVVTPEGTGPYPAIVVLHGCGGLLSDPFEHQVENHFRSWIEFGKTNKVVMIFPDSFNPRGFSEFCGFAPPDDAVCSPAYERTKDVADVLIWIAEQKFIDKDRLGIMGFSHGGSTTISSLINTTFFTLASRDVSNGGITYQVPGPVEMPSGLSFKAGVAYYPGAGFYGYFDDDYLPYAPLQIHAASLDPLYTSGSTEELVESGANNGASVQTGNEITLHVYEGASHSFDGATSGADGEADKLAKQRTIDWFRKHLKF